MVQEIYQSIGVKVWNGFSKIMPRSLMSPLLSTDNLMQVAQKESKLNDFGERGFVVSLEKLIDSINQEGGLHAFGKFYVKKMITGVLVNRLKLIDLWKRHPEILKEKIVSPFIVLGLPRTGTSFLFSLLSQDPAHRYLSSWESTISPVPPSGNYKYADDPRRKQGKFLLKFQNHLAPQMKNLHAFNLDGPEECTPILLHEFVNQSFAGMFNVPSYSKWTESASYASSYVHHKKVLQSLQWKYPGERWLLKSPQYIVGIEDVVDVYPDANLIQLHRDPVKVVSSYASLCAAFRGISSKSIDYDELGEQVLSRLSFDYKCYQQRRKNCDASRFLDLNYDDLVAEPIETVRKIYRHFDVSFTLIAEETMKAFLSKKRAGLKSHQYCPEDFGLTSSRIREQFSEMFSSSEFEAGNKIQAPINKPVFTKEKQQSNKITCEIFP